MMTKRKQRIPVAEESTAPPEYIRIIRELRIKASLTQEDVAEILGTSQTMYARYERGANELPIRHLITLAEVYQVTAGEILGLETGKDAQKESEQSQ